MRGPMIVSVCLLLCGCDGAVAAEPDSGNPAHCFAALNWSAFYLKKAGETEKVMDVKARALFERKKAQSQGQSDEEFLKHASAVTIANGKDGEKMFGLLMPCLEGEQADPYFQENYPLLHSLARSIPSKQ